MELLKTPPPIVEREKKLWNVRFPPIPGLAEFSVPKAIPLIGVEWKAHCSFLWKSALVQMPNMLIKYVSFMSEIMTEMGHKCASLRTSA